MSTTSTLETFFRHHLWANLLTLELCESLTSEQLDATVIGTYGSIRDTLVHIVSAERSYFARISTGQPYRRPDDVPPMTLEDMKESLTTTGDGLIDWAPRIRNTDSVEINWDGERRQVPKTILLTQAINHATEHRIQIMAILTHLGIQPPELDAWTYFDSMGRQQSG